MSVARERARAREKAAGRRARDRATKRSQRSSAAAATKARGSARAAEKVHAVLAGRELDQREADLVATLRAKLANPLDPEFLQTASAGLIMLHDLVNERRALAGLGPAPLEGARFPVGIGARLAGRSMQQLIGSAVQMAKLREAARQERLAEEVAALPVPPSEDRAPEGLEQQVIIPVEGGLPPGADDIVRVREDMERIGLEQLTRAAMGMGKTGTVTRQAEGLGLIGGAGGVE